MELVHNPRLAPAKVDELTQFALRLADAAAEVTLAHFRTALPVDNKTEHLADYDPVTIADKGAEEVIRNMISDHYPEHSVLGEEHGMHKGASDLTWVIDPIDGTRSFVAGVPLWGTLIALNDGAQPVIGVMDQPYIGERYVGRPGGSEAITRFGTHVLKASACTKLSEAIFATTDPALFDAEGVRPAFDSLQAKTRLRRFGGDCYFYCLLASGTIDLVLDPGMQAFDIQALIPIVEEAGGVVSNWEGGPAQAGGNIIAAATPELHQEALREIAASLR